MNNVREMRGESNDILREYILFALKVGIPVSSFIEKRIFFDEEARDEPTPDPEKKFRVELDFCLQV